MEDFAKNARSYLSQLRGKYRTVMAGARVGRGEARTNEVWFRIEGSEVTSDSVVAEDIAGAYPGSKIERDKEGVVTVKVPLRKQRRGWFGR